jgi:hypothetical protein
MDEQDRNELHAAVARIEALERFMREHTEAESARARRLENANTALRAEMTENTQMTKTLVDFVTAYKATKLVGRFAGRLLMFVALVGGGLATMLIALKTGRLP